MNVLFKDLREYSVRAIDSELGKVRDVYIDDTTWNVKYLAIDIRKHFPGKKVLLPPSHVSWIEETSADTHEILVSLKKDEIEKLPTVYEIMPEAWRSDDQYNDFYGWVHISESLGGVISTDPYYWADLGSRFAADETSDSDQDDKKDRSSSRKTKDPHLYSCNELRRHRLQPFDKIEDFFIADFVISTETWKAIHVVLSPWRWLHRSSVLLPTLFVGPFNRKEGVMDAKVTKRAIDKAPRFENLSILDNADDKRVMRHYRRFRVDIPFSITKEQTDFKGKASHTTHWLPPMH